MAIQIEVNELHVKHLTDFYIQRLKVLKDEISEKEREIKEISTTIQRLKKASQGAVPPIESPVLEPATDYQESWPWAKKVAFAIEWRDTPLTTKEIVDVLSEFEPSFIYDRKRAVASISSVLSTKSGPDKEFTKIQRESGEFAYHITSQNDQELPSPTEDLPF